VVPTTPTGHDLTMKDQPKVGDVVRVDVTLFIEVVDPDALVNGVRSRLARSSPAALDSYPKDDVIGAISGQYNAFAMVAHLDGLRPMEATASFTLVPDSERT
jgi:tetrahydromethanopterin S-methyltransferase subunit B